MEALRKHLRFLGPVGALFLLTATFGYVLQANVLCLQDKGVLALSLWQEDCSALLTPLRTQKRSSRDRKINELRVWFHFCAVRAISLYARGPRVYVSVLSFTTHHYIVHVLAMPPPVALS